MGRELYTDILLKGYESDLPIYNSLIFMYSKCSLVTEAHSIFVRVPIQDVVSWTTLISGYVDNGLYMIALKCFEEMKAGCVSPNIITFSCVLKACCSLGASDKGRDLHKELALRGLLNDSSIAINLISMYAKCGSLSEAQDVLSKLPVRDLASWTKLVQGYIECGASQEALKCFDQMQMECISLDAVAFACGLRACSALGSIEKGRDIHGCTLMKGLANALVVGNSLIGMYANCGSVLDAHLVFHKMPLQNSISWSALIVGYAEHGPGEEAIRLFDEMQLQGHFPNIVTFSSVLKACSTIKSLEKGREIHSCVSQCGLEDDPLVSNGLVHMYATCGELAEAQRVFDSIFAPDVVLWTELISGYADNGSGEKALHYFEQMQIQGVVPDTATFTCILKCCASIGAIGKGYEIHILLVKKGCCKELSIGNSLIGMYAACGSLSEAQNVFDMLEVHDIMSWTSLIAGYAEHGSGQVALKCFKEMKDEGFFTDAITFASVLKACGNIGALQKGREIHAMVVEEEFDEDLSVSNSLITMYSRCGALEEAKDIFYSTTIHDSTAWGSMMKGYCMAHDGNAAIQCFEDMQKEGIKPDTVTFTCLLNACSHASLVSEGITYYKSMREQYKIVPTIEHHTCIIDLLGRSGKLYEAENLLSLYPSDEATWSALLTACRTYVEPELGLRCFQELIEINREDATWYALMADIFANAGCGHAATHIEQLRTHAGVKKNTAVAIIEVNNEVHEFSVGCIERDEISRALKALNSFMLRQGHVPNLNRVLKPISDAEKEVVLCEHAEKVAIAFGLLNTPQGTTLRVTKNLRMCNDCHDVTKMISKIKNREIILRDTSCIHNFKDGMCSCGDLY
jgi:pentatricopeptide repeat protein